MKCKWWTFKATYLLVIDQLFDGHSTTGMLLLIHRLLHMGDTSPSPISLSLTYSLHGLQNLGLTLPLAVAIVIAVVLMIVGAWIIYRAKRHGSFLCWSAVSSLLYSTPAFCIVCSCMHALLSVPVHVCYIKLYFPCRRWGIHQGMDKCYYICHLTHSHKHCTTTWYGIQECRQRLRSWCMYTCIRVVHASLLCALLARPMVVHVLHESGHTLYTKSTVNA